MTTPAKKVEFFKLAGEVVRETEKAILMKCEVDTHCGRNTINVWFPRSHASLCEGGIKIADWLHKLKVDEAAKSFRRGYPGGGFICFIGVQATSEELI
jgi:hypothetical protein